VESTSLSGFTSFWGWSWGNHRPHGLLLTLATGICSIISNQVHCLLVIPVQMQTSDPTRSFQGLVVQARQSTSTFSNDASFVGSFTMAPAGGDWRIWACATVRSC